MVSIPPPSQYGGGNKVASRVSSAERTAAAKQPSNRSFGLLMATFFAIRDGLRDARECRPPYFWGLFSEKAERASMLKNGWKSVGKVFILAVVLDVVYQLIEHRWTVYPGEAVLVAIILAIVPYLLIRGPVNRIVCDKNKVVKERLAGD